MTTGRIDADHGKHIYAVGEELLIHIAQDPGSRWAEQNHGVDLVKHETLFHNAPVHAAGEIEITEGEVTAINGSSGSYDQCAGEYETNPAFAAVLLEAFREAGIPLSADFRTELEGRRGR